MKVKLKQAPANDEAKNEEDSPQRGETNNESSTEEDNDDESTIKILSREAVEILNDQ